MLLAKKGGNQGSSSESKVYHVTKMQKKVKRKKRRSVEHKAAKKMSQRALRRDGLYKLELDGAKYKDFLPMNALWNQYMVRMLGSLTEQANLDAVGPKILKSDFHGAFISVIESQSPSHLGLSGIVVMERKNVFVVITKKSRVVTIPKNGSVFQMKVSGLMVKLYGSRICFKASERMVKKFKD